MGVKLTPSPTLQGSSLTAGSISLVIEPAVIV